MARAGLAPTPIKTSKLQHNPDPFSTQMLASAVPQTISNFTPKRLQHQSSQQPNAKVQCSRITVPAKLSYLDQIKICTYSTCCVRRRALKLPSLQLVAHALLNAEVAGLPLNQSLRSRLDCFAFLASLRRFWIKCTARTIRYKKSTFCRLQIAVIQGAR